MKNLTILNFFILLMVSCNAPLEHTSYVNNNSNIESIIGYVDDDVFVPLVNYYSNNKIKRINNTETKIAGKLYNVFYKYEPIEVLGNIEVYDAYTGVKKKLLKIKQQNNSIYTNGFFSNNEIHIKSLQISDYTDLLNDFFEYLSTDDTWGRYYVKSEFLDKSLEEIQIKSDIKIINITDINLDSNIEIWLTYKTQYGKLGRMIYEVNQGNWFLIADDCLHCD